MHVCIGYMQCILHNSGDVNKLLKSHPCAAVYTARDSLMLLFISDTFAIDIAFVIDRFFRFYL